MFSGTLRAAALLGLATLVACNSGKHSSGTNGSSKSYYGPGSTGAGVTSGYGGGAGLGRFEAGPDMTVERGQHVATLMKDGRVLVTGGTDGQGILDTSEVFDAQTNTWTDTQQLAPSPEKGMMMVADPAGPWASARRHHSAVALLDGRVLIAGGHGFERAPGGNPVLEAMKSVYLFDPTTNTFTAANPLSENRFLHQSVALTDGRALVEGGVGLPTPQLISLTSLDIFDPITGNWTTQQTSPRSSGSGLTIPGKGAIFYGGADIIEYVSPNLRALAVMNFSIAVSEVWEDPTSRIRPGPQTTLPGASVMDVGGCMTTSGFALFAGGRTENTTQRPPIVLDNNPLFTLRPGTPTTTVVDTTERYDVAADKFLPGPKLKTKRWGAKCAELGMTSDVLIVGGVDEGNVCLKSCEVYSVRYDSIIGAVDLKEARQQFQALTLKDGRVMVIGGLDDADAGLKTTEFHLR